MYPVPSTLPPTSSVKRNNNVHFQPIDPAHASLVQSMDQALFNPLLNLVDDSPRPPSSSSSSKIHCGQMTPKGNDLMHTPAPHAPKLTVPPMPCMNQKAVDQHMGTRQTPVPPRSTTRTRDPQQQRPQCFIQVPNNFQLPPLPFVQAPPVPASQLSPTSPTDTRSKSKNG